MLRRALVGCMLIAWGCHHAPPARPPAAERPLAQPGDLAGSWVSSNDLDWGFALTIDATGMMNQKIERARMGLCEQAAQLTAGSAARTFAFTFAKDTCDEGGKGAARTLEVQSFTADQLDVIIRGGVTPLHRRYMVDPKASPVQ